MNGSVGVAARRERVVNDLLRGLMSPRGRVDPYPWYQRIAEMGPVVTSVAGWVVASGYDECARVLRDPTFITTGQARKTAADVVVGSGFTVSMLGSDGPGHRCQRQQLAGDFTGRMVEAMRPLARAAAARAADSLAAVLDRDGVGDLMEHVADPVPAAVVGNWSGAPREDWPELARTAAAAHLIMEMGLRASQTHAAARAFGQLRCYFEELMSNVGERGEELWPWSRGLPDDWVAANLALVTAAGTVTTSGLIGSAVLALSAHPELDPALVAADPQQATRVALEAHRYDGPRR